jgi:hypothetical protein
MLPILRPTPYFTLIDLGCALLCMSSCSISAHVVYVCVCVCVCVCICVCASACVRMCVCACSIPDQPLSTHLLLTVYTHSIHSFSTKHPPHAHPIHHLFTAHSRCLLTTHYRNFFSAKAAHFQEDSSSLIMSYFSLKTDTA